jgi:hypothetical protein
LYGSEKKGLAGKAIRKTMKTKGEQFGDGVTNLQTAPGERVWKLLIPKESGAEGTPTPVFWSKSAQAIENKRPKYGKLLHESSRARKRMKVRKLRMFLDGGRLEDLGERVPGKNGRLETGDR